MWNRQASGYHRFFSQFTIPVGHPLLDAARVTAGSTVLDAGADPGYAARVARARGAPRSRRRPVGGHAQALAARGIEVVVASIAREG